MSLEYVYPPKPGDRFALYVGGNLKEFTCDHWEGLRCITTDNYQFTWHPKNGFML